ncbi:MAG: hypothetical protein AAFV07_15515 [Bacteroidota bacterium]
MQRYTWFFTLTEALNPATEQALTADFGRFAAQWQSHGTPVDGLIRIKHSRFVIAQANPGDDRPSGCSIDSLKRGISQILQHHQLPTLDNAYVCYQGADASVAVVHFQQIPTLVADGTLGADTLVFDHTLSQSDDLNKWEVSLKDTWLARFLPKQAAG